MRSRYGSRPSLEQYQANILPLVTPLAMDPAHPFPFISNLSLNLLVALRYRDEEEPMMNRVKVPLGSGVPRFLRIDGGTQNDIFAYRAILSAHEGQARMRIGRTVIPQGNIELSTGLVGNNIVLRDNYYNKRAIIGKMDLKSKSTWIEQGAPFFSIVLLDEKGDVLWSAE